MTDTEARCASCGHIDDVLLEDGLCVTCWTNRMDVLEGVVHRYFLTVGDGPEEEVTKEKWVRTERGAGFHNTLGFPDEPATAGFSTTANGGLKGRTERERTGG